MMILILARYGMFLYEKGKYESGAWLDETMPIGDFDFYKQVLIYNH